MDNATPTNIELWNELQNLKVRLIEMDSKLDAFIVGIENIKAGFLAAIEEYEKEENLKEVNNG